MPIVGEAHIHIRALDKNFRSDVERAVGKLKNVGIELKVDADISPAQKKIDALRKDAKTVGVKVAVRADTSKIEEDIKKATSRVKSVKVPVTADYTGFIKSVRELNDRVKNLKIKVPVYADPKFFKRDIDKAVRDAKINPVKLPVQVNTSEVQSKVEEAAADTVTIPMEADTSAATAAAESARQQMSRPGRMPVTVDVDSLGAEAHIAWVTRARKVKVVMDFEKSAINAFKGVIETLSGVPPVDQVRAAIEGLLSDFSAVSIKSGIMVAALGAVGTAFVSLGASAFTIVSDLGNLVGLLAALPAALVGGMMGMKAFKTAFEGYGAAVKKGGEAISALRPLAQESAAAMHKVVSAMNIDIKDAFWNEAQENMHGFAMVIMPKYASQVVKIAGNFGNAFSNMLDEVMRFDRAGRLVPTFNQIADGLAYMSDAVQPLTRVFLTLGEAGAKHIMALGQAVRVAAEDFDTFVEKARQTGQIDVWIEQGVQALKDLGSIVSSTVSIFGSLATAARNAGYGGLSALAEGLRDVARAVDSALAMERLETIFRSAAVGTEQLVRGLGLLGDTFMESSDQIGQFMEIVGEIGRITFENLDALINADGFADGILRAMDGLRTGLDSATPGFEAFGRIVGNLGQIMGTLFEVMAPGFNNLMITIDNILRNLTTGFIAAMPVVNQFIDMLAQMARGPLTLAAFMIGKLLELFAALPGPVQNTVIAVLGLNTALRALAISGGAIGLLGGKLDNVGKRASGSSGLVSKLGTALGAVAIAGGAASRGAQKVSTDVDKAGAASGRASGKIAGLGSALGAMVGGLGGASRGAADASTATAKAGASAGGSAGKFAALGGAVKGLARGYLPLFAAVTAITGAFTVYEETTGSTITKTADLSTALQQYGSSSKEARSVTQDLVSSHKGFAESVIDLIPGVEKLNGGTTNAARGFKNLGWDVEDVASKINASGGQWTDQRQKVEDLIASTGMFGTVSEKTSQQVLGTSDAVGMTGEQLRAMRDAMDDANRAVEEHYNAQVKAHQAAKESANFNRQVAEAVGLQHGPAIRAAEGYAVLADATSSVDDKMSAFQSTMAFVTSNLTEQNRGLASNTEAKMMNAQASADISESLTDISSRYANVNNQLIDSTGAFNHATQAGRDFFFEMQGVATQIQEVAVSAYDAALKSGDSMTVASQKATDAIAPMTDQIRTMLATLGITGEEEVNKVLSALKILPEDVTMALNAESNAAEVALETKMIVEGLMNGNYEMALSAVNEPAMGAIAELVGAGDDFKAGNYEAVFHAIAEKIGVDETVKLLEGTAGKDFEAIMKIIAENPALQELEETEAFMAHLDGTSAEATISAVNDLYPSVQDALGSLSEINEADAEARLGAIDDLSFTARTALAEALKIDSANPQAILDAIDNLSPEVREGIGVVEDLDGRVASINMDAVDNATPQVIGAIDQAIDFDGTTATATLDALDNLSHTARTALAEVLGIDEAEGHALLEAINNASPEAQKALGDIAGIDGVTSEAVLEATNNVSQESQVAISAIQNLDGLTGTARLDAIDNASQASREALAEVLGINSAEGTAILSAIDQLTPEAQTALNKLIEVDTKDVVANIMAEDQATSKIQTAGFNLDMFMQKPSNKDVSANDNATPTIGSAIASLFGFTSAPSSKTLTATDSTGPGVGSAQGTMNTLQDVQRSLLAQSLTGEPTMTAQATMSSLQDVMRQLQATNATGGPKGQAQSTMNSLKDVMRQLEASNKTGGPKGQAQATMNSLKDVMRDLEAQNQTGGPKSQAQGTINSLKGKSVDLTANNRAGEGVSAAQGVINSLKGKVVDVITNFISRGSRENANGGIYNGKGQTVMAQGGIMKAEAFANGGIKLPATVNSFASGSENHVAQISQGKWPVRIWSEPETGGEAYIPLGLSKRPRSLDILKQVAEMFGFSLVKKFADGGILNSIKANKSNVFANGGFSGQNVTNYVSRTNSSSEVAPGQIAQGNTVYSPNIYVTPSAPLNEEQLADSVASELFWRIKNGI